MILSQTYQLSLAVCTAVLLSAQPVKSMPVLAFDFTPTTVTFDAGGAINFDMDALFDDFTIDGQNGGSSLLDNLTGEIDGDFDFFATGDITSTLGTLSIDDEVDGVLSGDLNFDTINYVNFGPSAQVINISGLVDFNAYSGSASNTDLLSLFNNASPFEISASFIYEDLASLMTLADLIAFGDDAKMQLSANGVVALPEPLSLTLLGLGVLGIGFFSSRRRRDDALGTQPLSASR